jgi:hypothetical protein
MGHQEILGGRHINQLKEAALVYGRGKWGPAGA